MKILKQNDKWYMVKEINDFEQEILDSFMRRRCVYEGIDIDFRSPSELFIRVDMIGDGVDIIQSEDFDFMRKNGFELHNIHPTDKHYDLWFKKI